jgi:hypothetical protein
MGAYGDEKKYGGGRMPDGSTSWTDVTPSPLGGNQGQQGMFLGKPYEAFSFADFVVESYSGSHDYLSSFRYTSSGGNLIGYGSIASAAYTAYSGAAVLLATPFAFATRAPAYAFVPSAIGNDH